MLSDGASASTNVTKKKSFWQLRPKFQGEDSHPLRTTGLVTCTTDEKIAGTALFEQDVKKPIKYKLQRVVEWIKSWSRKKKQRKGHAYQELHTTFQAGERNPIPSIERDLSSSPRLVSSAIDGTSGQPLHHPLRGSFLFHRQSHHQLRGGLNPAPITTLKHSSSSPGFIRKKLSQPFQGTVIKRSSNRRLNNLAALPSDLFSGAVSALPRCNVPIPDPVIPNDETHTILRTIEVTAAAKIYLESHFSRIMTFPNNRSVRRRNFESQLVRRVSSEYERSVLREEWKLQETAYLRCLRSKPLSVGDYEIVKILGKGAFGVVKLVREREHSPSLQNHDSIDHNDPITTRLESRPLSEAPRRDLSNFNNCNNFESDPPSQEVKSATFNNHSKVYALKVMQKSELLMSGQEGHLRAERDLLVAGEGSKWIVPLIAAFQDSDNLYLVMEYLIGGDLLALLIKRTVLTEEETKFYAAEMICCIEEAHALGYIHRDIKPDNFLITAEGHLKLCDFGLAFSGDRVHDEEYLDQRRHGLLKRTGIVVEGDAIDRQESRRILEALNENVPLQYSIASERNSSIWVKTDRALARSIVGTNQYMAPEVVRGDPYDGRCDWWSLGIIIYECLYGFTPFCSGTCSETRQKILNWRTTLSFPLEPTISPRAYHLIASLLCEKQHRLTSKAYAANDKQRHNNNLHQGYSNAVFNHRGDGVTGAAHVLAHDGVEIRAHPLFNGIDWHSLHTVKPPFIPEGLSGCDDTKYFDEDSYPTMSVSLGTYEQLPRHDSPDAATRVSIPEGKVELKVKKRARDRLLRDPIHGKDLLELRKEVAFWGYTYRRPKSLELSSNAIITRRRVTLAALVDPSSPVLTHRVPEVLPLIGKRVVSDEDYSGTTLEAVELI